MGTLAEQTWEKKISRIEPQYRCHKLVPSREGAAIAEINKLKCVSVLEI